MYQRGDIVRVLFPFSDFKDTKERPALVVSNDIIHDTSDIIILAISSKSKDTFLQLKIEDQHVLYPMPKQSYVCCHRILTIESKLIIEKWSSIRDPHFMRQVLDKIDLIIGFYDVLYTS
jgi:mRNA-degrading endonuclease toxin of MazEF toxin-antitoxin module